MTLRAGGPTLLDASSQPFGSSIRSEVPSIITSSAVARAANTIDQQEHKTLPKIATLLFFTSVSLSAFDNYWMIRMFLVVIDYNGRAPNERARLTGWIL
jgi:hypothetical protein